MKKQTKNLQDLKAIHNSDVDIYDTFTYVDIVSSDKAFDGCINLFFGDDCVALVNKRLATKIKKGIPKKILSI